MTATIHATARPAYRPRAAQQARDNYGITIWRHGGLTDMPAACTIDFFNAAKNLLLRCHSLAVHLNEFCASIGALFDSSCRWAWKCATFVACWYWTATMPTATVMTRSGCWTRAGFATTVRGKVLLIKTLLLEWPVSELEAFMRFCWLLARRTRSFLDVSDAFPWRLSKRVLLMRIW